MLVRRSAISLIVLFAAGYANADQYNILREHAECLNGNISEYLKVDRTIVPILLPICPETNVNSDIIHVYTKNSFSGTLLPPTSEISEIDLLLTFYPEELLCLQELFFSIKLDKDIIQIPIAPCEAGN